MRIDNAMNEFNHLVERMIAANVAVTVDRTKHTAKAYIQRRRTKILFAHAFELGQVGYFHYDRKLRRAYLNHGR